MLIFGGGIAGLWTLLRLRSLGYDALLVESDALGATQSIGSQGIIHGGVKYALLGEITGAARAIAAMPERWHACLSGQGEIDLSAPGIVLGETIMWTTPGLVSKLAALTASKLFRSPVAKLAREQWAADLPAAWQAAPPSVSVYRISEPVLDIHAVFQAFRAKLGPCILRGRLAGPPVDGAVRIARAGDADLLLAPKSIVCCAGPGNPDLLAALGAITSQEVATIAQRRPLHMAMLRGAPFDLHGHCLGASNLPRLTITTGHDEQGQRIWYLGGEIAERGVTRQEPEQIAAAKAELAACLPWCPIEAQTASWATCRWDRAEPVTAGINRPDMPIVKRFGPSGSSKPPNNANNPSNPINPTNPHPRILAAWPTKLAFAPLLADRVVAELGLDGMSSAATVTQAGPITEVSECPIALMPWQSARWSR